MTLCRYFNPSLPWSFRLSGILPPFRSLRLHSFPLRALSQPRSVFCPADGAGLWQGPASASRRTSSGHFPSRGFSFLKCPVSGGLGCLRPKSSARAHPPEPPPLFRPAAPPPAPRSPRAGVLGQSSPCLGHRHLEFSVASGYAFFPGRSPNPAPPGSHGSPDCLSRAAPLGSWDPGRQPEPGAGLCAISASSPRWPPGAWDSGSCCCCCCYRHLLRPRPRPWTVPGVATQSTQVKPPGSAQ